MKDKLDILQRTEKHRRANVYILLAIFLIPPLFFAIEGLPKAAVYVVIVFVIGVGAGSYLEQAGILIASIVSLLMSLWLVPFSATFDAYFPVERWFGPEGDRMFWAWTMWMLVAAVLGGLLGMIVFWERLGFTEPENDEGDNK